jgi:hypothetical protein
VARLHAREVSKIIRFDFFSNCGKLGLVICPIGSKINWKNCWDQVDQSDLNRWRQQFPITMEDLKSIIISGKKMKFFFINLLRTFRFLQEKKKETKMLTKKTG